MFRGENPIPATRTLLWEPPIEEASDESRERDLAPAQAGRDNAGTEVPREEGELQQGADHYPELLVEFQGVICESFK